MLLALAAAVFLFLGDASAQSGLETCPSNCIGSVFANPTGLGCASGDQACACRAGANFNFAIRDCITQGCPSLTGDALASQITAAQAAASSDCAIATGTVASASTSPPAATPTPTTVASPVTTTSSASVVSTPSAASTLQTATTPTTATSATAQSSSAASTSVLSTAATSTATTTTASSTSSKASSSSTVNAAAAASTNTSSSSSDLSIGAKAGIGAGAGVALILSGILLCYFLSRKRKGASNSSNGQSRQPTLEISRPMPGSGRQYAHDVEALKVGALSTQFSSHPASHSLSSASSGHSPKQGFVPSRPSRDDDHYYNVPARRYEDMVPRAQPRTMI